MITLSQSKIESNANQTGVQQFTVVKQGTNPVNGKNVYIFKRTFKDGKVFGYESIISSVKKAGTYPLPPKGSGKTITYEEDFEEYPGASQFGRTGFFCINMERAEARFKELMGEVIIEEEPEVIPTPKEPSVNKAIIVPLTGEFTINEYAAKNGIAYVNAYLLIKQKLVDGSVIFIREERRHARGKPCKIYREVKS